MNHIYEVNQSLISIYCFPTLIDYDINNYMERYYSKNKKALIKIKEHYDPYNLFKYKQSIPVINKTKIIEID